MTGCGHTVILANRGVPDCVTPDGNRWHAANECPSVHHWMRSFPSRTALERSRLCRLFSTSEPFASRFFLPQTRSVRLLWLCFDQNARRYWTASHAHLFTVFEQLYSPWEVAYNNTKQYKHKQDRTDRTEKKRHATCTMWRKWWWRWWWQKLPSTVAHSFLRG